MKPVPLFTRSADYTIAGQHKESNIGLDFKHPRSDEKDSEVMQEKKKIPGRK